MNNEVMSKEEAAVSALDRANQYIKDNMFEVSKKHRNMFHADAPIGWMNDPNGFIYYKGLYHLFYQFNPYKTEWGTIYWGHYTSANLVKWEMQPVALAPDMDYDIDLGVFSGTAIEYDEKLYVMYTGTSKTKLGVERQQQCIAISEDGFIFEKQRCNPVISTEQIPDGYDKVDFRDPAVFMRNGIFYCLVGVKYTDPSSAVTGGQLLLYKSPDMVHWEYVGALMQTTIAPSGVLECPDIFELGNQDVIICSPQNLALDEYKYQNIHSVLYFIGNLNLATGEYFYETMYEIDSGFDFYAPQTLKTTDGRIIMTAWMNMWDRVYPTAKDGWVGSAILPRELQLKDGKLYQYPIREIEAYRTNEILFKDLLVSDIVSLNGVEGNCIELLVEVDLRDSVQFGIKLYKGETNETVIYYDRKSSMVSLDRSKNGQNIIGDVSERHLGAVRKALIETDDNILTFRIFLDKSTIEVFLQEGERTMTANVYPEENDIGVQFFTVGGNVFIKNLSKYDIKVS